MSATESPSPAPRVVDTLNVAFWNLQNLFDIEVSPIAADLDFTPVHGWDRRAFEAKVTNLAEIIRLMFDGEGPDLLGICEIENERVANILIDAIGRDDYALAHVEHPDIRGIDTSLIYSTKRFQLDESRLRGHLVHLRFPTRDIFEVHLKVRSNDADLVVLVNHWPSRSLGRLESEPFRLTVASHCGQLVDENLKLSRREYLALSDTEVSLHRLNEAWDRNVLVMGDLNDEPWNRSVLDILKAGYTIDHLEEPIRFARGSLPSYKAYASKSAYLFNPMWSLMSAPDSGTHYYSRSTQTMSMLDQFMLSRGLHFGQQGLQPAQRPSAGDPDILIPDVDIFRPEPLTTRKGRPREFNRETRSGYSDHFPITMQLSVLETDASQQAPANTA
ncbi:MAG: endonuclease/exonuclease/phosphatase family protein [Planctomycetaceae bacterium]|nr:endonuclease/exonuclease/phosphatase family protein [Planctomycetaceae bacterium]